MFWGGSLLQHQQWNFRQSHLIATSAMPLLFHVLYNLSVLSRQNQVTANLYPLPTFRTCVNHRNYWRSCSAAPTFAVLRIEEWRTRQWLVFCVQSVLRWVQLHSMNCSHDLAFWTVYYQWTLVFFVSEGLRYSVLAAVSDLVTVGALG